jgi:TfoX/Sxy family transcriptional regulator of competence genes
VLSLLFLDLKGEKIMPYDESLADRIRLALGPLPGLEAKKMFGGVGFLLNDKMLCGVVKNDMVVRVGAQKYAWALSQPHVRLFDMTGRPMTGWVLVDPTGCSTPQDLQAWLDLALDFIRS